MKILLKFLPVCLAITLILVSCRKDITPTGNPVESAVEQSFSSSDPSRKELRRTILGEKRNNPYTVENMNKAYKNLYGKDGDLKATHRYIKFKASTPEHFQKLAKSKLNLYDYPLDYEVIEMGDYYKNDNAPESEVYNLYTAAAMDSEIPDVPYEAIENLYLYSADEPLIREAIELVGYNPDVEGYIVADTEGGGGGGGGGNTPEATAPLVRAADCSCRNGSNQRNPSGCIKVQDTKFSTAGNCNTYMAVRRAKVILKDTWFTEDEVWTNDNGCFSRRDRRYKGKCWMWVKFTNDRGHIRSARSGINALWDWLFVVKDYVGVIHGPTFNNIEVCYDFSTDAGSTAHYFWAAATVNNALHEYYDHAARRGLGTPPSDLDIYTGRNHSYGYTMMADKLTDKGPIVNNLFLGGVVSFQYFSNNKFLLPFTGILTMPGAILSGTFVLPFMPDVYIGATPQRSDGTTRSTDLIKELAYHEFGHAAHYQNISWGFRNDYWIPNIGYVVANGGYGARASTNSGKCAVIETWGYHIGATIASEAYGTLSSSYCLQSDGTTCLNSGFSSTSNSSYLIALEAYNPNLTADPTRWIPIGVLHDMLDFQEETRVVDQCNGFTHSDFFNALNDDVNTIEKFRDRILQNTSNRQSTQVNQLFQSYGY